MLDWGAKTDIFFEYVVVSLSCLTRFFRSMRSKVPCTACGKISSKSGFVFKNSVSKCVCKLCYNREKRFQKVTVAREKSSSTSTSASTSTSHETDHPTVIDVGGMFLVSLDMNKKLLVSFNCNWGLKGRYGVNSHVDYIFFQSATMNVQHISLWQVSE